MTRSRIALFPGSFDPITVGHESVIRRALPMFDKIIVGVGVNSEKSAMLPSEKRVEMIKKVFADEPKVEVVTYSGLTVDFCKANNISFILRGLRTSADFEFERSIGHANQLLDKNIERKIDTLDFPLVILFLIVPYEKSLHKIIDTRIGAIRPKLLAGEKAVKN